MTKLTPLFIRLIFNEDRDDIGTDVPWDDFIYLVNRVSSTEPGNWSEAKVEEMEAKYGGQWTF